MLVHWFLLLCCHFSTEKVKTEARIMEGDVGKALCHETVRINPAALVMGTRGLGIIKR